MKPKIMKNFQQIIGVKLAPPSMGALGLTLLCCLANVLHGQSSSQEAFSEDGDNFRGLCRRDLSTAYAELVNESQRADDQASLHNLALKKLNIQKNQQVKKRDAVAIKLKNSSYDAELIQKHGELDSFVRTLDEQIQSSLTQRDVSKQQAEIQRQKLRQIGGLVRKVFKLVTFPDPEGLDKKIFNQLQWLHQCPPYRLLCPLPEDQAKYLNKIMESFAFETSHCRKYLAIKSK
jgi:hypothetical protein